MWVVTIPPRKSKIKIGNRVLEMTPDMEQNSEEAQEAFLDFLKEQYQDNNVSDEARPSCYAVSLHCLRNRS